VTNTRAYQNAYEQKRRDRCRATGRCVMGCGRKRRPGVAPTGKPFSRCQPCIERHARAVVRWRQRRRKEGFCTSCPRRMPRGDKRWECARCRKATNVYGAGYYQRNRDAMRAQKRRYAA
jgi:hypothetical protein